MERLSATIITRNEEKNIGRCLEALKGVADEIIVVDSYSTDRTLDICRRYGCKITNREFQGFGSQRQYATGLTTNSYVLSIDADEVLDDEMRDFLIHLKTHGFDHRVYMARVQNYFCGLPLCHSGFEPAWKVRLFNKRYANWNLRDVSDKVTYPDSVVPFRLPGTIHHFRCDSLDEFYKKENRIASLEARVIAASNSSVASFMPRVRATWQYVKCHIYESAWLDGSAGFTIARRRAKTTYEAYRMARHIIGERGNKQSTK